MKRTTLLALALLIPLSLICFPLALADDAGSGSAVAIAVAGGTGSGSAVAVVPSLPDPMANPSQAVTTAWGLVHQYGWLWGSMIVLFGIGTVIVKINDSRHWLSQDHALPIIVGLLGTLGAALQAKFAGGSWAGVIATGVAALMLLLQKPTPGKPTPATA